LAIREKAFGPDHPDVATSLNDLANLHLDQGRHADAEPLYKRSLAILEKTLGPDHPHIATSLDNLALVYTDEGRYADAESLYKQLLPIQEHALGPSHPRVARSLNDLAWLYVKEGRYADALPLVRTAAQMGFARKSVFLAVLTGAAEELTLTNADAFNEAYQVVQRATSTAASKAINQLAVRFTVGNNQMAQLVRRDQDLMAAADRLDKDIIASVSRPPEQRNALAEGQIRRHIEEIKAEREKLRDVLAQRFPDYVALSYHQASANSVSQRS
jgi:tetratricopeptide (TPR) repeat protein